MVQQPKASSSDVKLSIKEQPELKKPIKRYVVDTDLCRELYLFAENDSEIYKEHAEVIAHHLAKVHMKYGYIGREQAKKYIIGFWVEPAANKYRKEIGPLPNLTAADKDNLGNIFLDVYQESIENILKEGKQAVKGWMAYNKPLPKLSRGRII